MQILKWTPYWIESHHTAMSTKKNIFYAVVIIQAIILLYLVLSQMVSFEGYSYAWFYNSNQEIQTITNSNDTHVCIPIKPKVVSSSIFLMIIVTSQSLKEDKREAIRETWAKEMDKFTETKIQLMFVFGCTRSIHLDRDVDREATHKPQILRVAFNEGEPKYEIRRLLEAYQFAAQYRPKFILKISDDVYIYLPKLLSWLYNQPNTTELYAGRVATNVQVTRDLQRRYYVSEEEYSSNTFPDFCSAAFYILSGNLFQKIVSLSSKVTMFNVEDAYIGLLVQKLRVEPTDISNTVAHIDERTVHEVQSWNNRMFGEVFAIGYNLPPNMLQYIHDRYRRLENPKDTVH